MRWLSVVAAMTTLFFVAPYAEASVEFEELLPPAGERSVSAWAVNEAGQAVGAAHSTGDALRWDGAANPVRVGSSLGIGVNGRGDVLTYLRLNTVGPLLYSIAVWENGQEVDRSPQGRLTVPFSVRDINDSGVVPVGYRHNSDGGGYETTRGGTWRNGRFADLPFPKATKVAHRVVNTKGTTAGSLTPLDGTGNFAFRCSATTCTRLPAAGPAGTHDASALNESDVLAGTWWSVEPRSSRAVVWNGTAVTVLPGVNAGVADNPRAINERGDVVGRHEVDGVRKPALWRGGRLVDLGATGTGEAVAVNDRGDVAGWHTTADGVRPFFWHAGTLTDLRTPNDLPSKASGLNNAGVVIGTAEQFGPPSRAYRWTVRY
ncbi:hypothetical protein [Saccharothrix obliqua]|uniref:hypothetical protein n=1 Tax=Saccharothrix obliqua TaxID=2861747 RepID=UPI001C5DBDA6|nr:hypothetical protein [Saccharothrix obliqua]MBW4722152.1 hypothetical protein [Saccharothrix obliqua]